MKPKKSKTKKRNRAAQDTTLINIRALKKRVDRLEQLTDALIKDVSKLWDRK